MFQNRAKSFFSCFASFLTIFLNFLNRCIRSTSSISTIVRFLSRARGPKKWKGIVFQSYCLSTDRIEIDRHYNCGFLSFRTKFLGNENKREYTYLQTVHELYLFPKKMFESEKIKSRGSNLRLVLEISSSSLYSHTINFQISISANFV